MSIEHSEIMWLDNRHDVSLAELVELSGLLREDLELLVDSGVLIPNNLSARDWHFSCHCVASMRKLSRLKQDFELEPNSLGLMLVFLERIQNLELKLHALDQAKMTNDAELS